MTGRPDVRMRGFRDRTTVPEARRWVDGVSIRLDSENVCIDDAHGRILSSDVICPLDVPAFDRAAMDGFAVQATETTGADDYNPLSCSVIGEARPGAPFEGKVTSRTAVRIMTGAPQPDGADAVVPAEYATESAGRVEMTLAVASGKHVGRRGEDVRAGSQLLLNGRCLRPQDVGLLASVGIDQLAVVRRPQVRLLITGGELVAPGSQRGPFQIYDANSSMLRGLVQRDGGVLESVHRVSDSPELIQSVMQTPGADVLLVSGGSSVGAEDHAPILLNELGELTIHGIAMRPSSPTGMGRIGSTLVFLLPGNPVSCLCAYDFFAGRALRQLGGRTKNWPYRSVRVVLARKISSAVGRIDYCRVSCLTQSDSHAERNPIVVDPIAVSGASVLSSTTRADGFVVIPAESEGYPADSIVTMHTYSFNPDFEDQKR